MRKNILTLLAFLWLFSCAAQITIVVNAVPGNTPVDDPIYIVGDFNNWNPEDAAYQLEKEDQGNAYQITFANNPGRIEYKFTRGGWGKVEGNANGTFLPNRQADLSDGDTLWLSIASWEDLGAVGGGGGMNSTAADNVFILSNEFYMPQLQRNRRVWIYLPPDYASSNKRYPVLYMHDGQNIFDRETSFSGEWQVDETLNRLHANGDPGIIVVAIDNGGQDRLNEYSPWVHPTYGGGMGDQYIDFIVESLKPTIDNNYRTKSDRLNTGIMGSSMGGLISTYAGIEHPEVFGKIGALSPAYWFSQESFNQVGTKGKQADARIYQLIGKREGDSYVQDMYRMENALLDAGFDRSEVLSVEKADGEHSEWFWAREFEAAYLWLFRTALTNTNEFEQWSNQFQLSPNPASDQLQLQLHLWKTAVLEVDLMDSLGTSIRNLFKGQLPSGSHSLDLQLNRSDLPEGLYYCNLRIGDQTLVKQLVIATK